MFVSTAAAAAALFFCEMNFSVERDPRLNYLNPPMTPTNQAYKDIRINSNIRRIMQFYCK